MANQLVLGIQKSLLGFLLVTLGSACVSQERYDEALDAKRRLQIQYQDMEDYQGSLEEKIARLEGQKALTETGPQEASVTRPFDERLSQLKVIMEGLGASPGDLTVLRVEGGYGVRLDDSVLFDSGSSSLKPEGQALLLKVAAKVKERSFERIWVRGHTDSDPVKKAATLQKYPHGNIQLSADRAMEVAALLSSKGGIPKSRLVIAGFGASDPVAANTSSASKSKNRRVDIYIIEDAPAGK
jgi:chemotaxis protein MotB